MAFIGFSLYPGLNPEALQRRFQSGCMFCHFMKIVRQSPKSILVVLGVKSLGG